MKHFYFSKKSSQTITSITLHCEDEILIALNLLQVKKHYIYENNWKNATNTADILIRKMLQKYRFIDDTPKTYTQNL